MYSKSLNSKLTDLRGGVPVASYTAGHLWLAIVLGKPA